MTSVGLIGVGSMGHAMATRLLEAGVPLHVWNRTPSVCEGLVSVGAKLLDEAEDAFSCDIVVSMLANDNAVAAVFTEEMLRRHPGKLHVNMASISLNAAREQATSHSDAGVRYLAAPVLGRPEVAAAGQLSILAGGTAEDVKEAKPILDVLGKKTWHVSANPAGANLVKIGVNYNLIHALQAIGESVNLVERGGVDPQLFVDILTDAFFTGAVYTTYGRIIAERKYFPAAFNTRLGLKELFLAEQAASEVRAALPAAPVLRDIFEAAADNADLRDGDWSIIAEVIRGR